MHQQAQKAALKVKYEWDMFDWLANEIPARSGAVGWQEQSLLTEGIILHTRVLLDFFMNSPCSRNDDITACHYFDNPQDWESCRKGLCQYSAAEKRRIHKKLAHLTYSRITMDETWEFETIRDEMRHAWERFLSALPEDRRKWFET